MELYNTNFLNLRNKYIIPKVHYGIKRNKYKYWNLKDILSNNIISLKKLAGKSFEIELSKEDYYKAIHCEIELFMNKSTIQHKDLLKQTDVSKTWSFVTLYYLSFFSITLLFRFIDRGFLFFSREQLKKISDFSLAVYSEVIEFPTGNYYFNLKEINELGNAVITLTYKGDNVHKTSWIYFEEVINEFCSNSKDHELLIYNYLLNFFKKNNFEFPSRLRNKLNYNGESSILDIDDILNESKILEVNSKFLRSLSSINQDDKTENNLISQISHFCSYFFELNNKLYEQYKLRNEYCKPFEKDRSLL